MPEKLTVISLFSGGGGLDLGLAAAGFSILFENDIDEASCRTLALNGPLAKNNGLGGFENTVTKAGDIRKLTGSEILKLAKTKRQDVDVLAGGPPCQAFSVFGKRLGTDDQRGQLSFEYKRVLNEIAPKVFVFENVAGLLSIENGDTYQRLLKELAKPSDDLEYEIFASRVDAHDYHVPQNRDRVIVIGVRKDVALEKSVHKVEIRKTASNPEDSSLPDWRTVSDALRGLPIICPTDRNNCPIANHHGRRHSKQVSERYKNLAPGERDSKTRINKLDLSKPSFTIVVGSDKGGGKGHVHPSAGREVTPRESARIQTFPDWWVFTGSVRDEIRQVGNAVPALLGFAIGNAIRTDVFGFKAIPLKKGIERLGQTHLLGPSC